MPWQVGILWLVALVIGLSGLTLLVLAVMCAMVPLAAEVERIVEAEPIGTLDLKGFRRPVMTHNVLNLTAD